MNFEIYPLTITKDRYDGIYSGGKYLAWNKNPEDVPPLPFEKDKIADDYWAQVRKSNYGKNAVGIGNTIDAAIQDLILRLGFGCFLNEHK